MQKTADYALGYAYATTSYRANGLVADLAVEDVAQLAQEVRRRFRPDPVRTYVVGVSEGGLVAALTAERHADLFDGAVAACGPVGDFTAQIDYFGDFRVVFDHYFPGVIPGDPMNVKLKDFNKAPAADVNATCTTCHNRGEHALWQGSQHESRGLAESLE